MTAVQTKSPLSLSPYISNSMCRGMDDNKNPKTPLTGALLSDDDDPMVILQ
jgi:hypothetical protein